MFFRNLFLGYCPIYSWGSPRNDYARPCVDLPQPLNCSRVYLSTDSYKCKNNMNVKLQKYAKQLGILQWLVIEIIQIKILFDRFWKKTANTPFRCLLKLIHAFKMFFLVMIFTDRIVYCIYTEVFFQFLFKMCSIPS